MYATEWSKDDVVANETTCNTDDTTEEQAPTCPLSHRDLNEQDESNNAQPAKLTDDIGEVEIDPDYANAQTKNVARPLKRKVASSLKKAPEAPKRFKSAYIFFSAEKHKEIRAQMGEEGLTAQTSVISKLVSNAWKELAPEDKEKWEEMAVTDKARYDVEKTLYKGPWQVPRRRTPKDASAPKRPMSSFLAFANSQRASVKERMPTMTNGEISKALAVMWREASDEVRKPYINWEKEKRLTYKVAMSQWRRNEDERKRLVRHHREEKALSVALTMKDEIVDDSRFNDPDAPLENTGADANDDTYQAASTRSHVALSMNHDIHAKPIDPKAPTCNSWELEPPFNHGPTTLQSARHQSLEHSTNALYNGRRGAPEGHYQSTDPLLYPWSMDTEGMLAGANTNNPAYRHAMSASSAAADYSVASGFRTHGYSVPPRHHEALFLDQFVNPHAYNDQSTVHARYTPSSASDGWWYGSDGFAVSRQSHHNQYF